MTRTVIGRVRAVLAGQARPYTRPGSRSAIDKQPLHGAVAVGPLGVAGDAQGDLRVHGGPDKAVHCYAWAHYAQWRVQLPATCAPLLEQPGAFGENLSLDGLDEHGSCIGDRWQIGSAQFEVSQGRQPCWKLNDRFGVPDMALRVQDGGRAGWYLRLSQPGEMQAGDAVLLLARPHPHWTVARLLQLIADRDCDPRVLNAVLELPLPSSWQRLFSRRRERGQSEDWAARLIG
ncbi:MAG: MOSC domain-containing protein [Comamonadaceae bacterium]|nr:MAG: MOSC domain-containing protein [Comamonadaceae bacterium]